jgi:hypothetical protein
MVAAASPAGRMKPVNLTAKLAAVETELACLKMALAQVKEDRDELRQDWAMVVPRYNSILYWTF